MIKHQQTENSYAAYDPKQDSEYQKALDELKKHSKKKPVYKDSYSDELDRLYRDIVDRPSFQYDMNSDALYQQYKDSYINYGIRAMRDSSANAAHLTGGYASSYSQALGQQQYGSYMQQLSAMVPELYDRALGTYQLQGQQMQDRYNLLDGMADEEYQRYQDELAQYNSTLQQLSQKAKDAYQRGFENTNDAYKKLTELMAFSGYVPSDEDLKAAGMTREQANAYLNAWKAANPLLAWQTGSITEDEYRKYTGTNPPGVGAVDYGYRRRKKDDEKDDNANDIAARRAQIERDYNAGRIDYDDRERLVNDLYNW